MYAGDIIIKNNRVYLRTIDDEELLFIWNNKELQPDNLWIRMLMAEHAPVCYVGVRMGCIFNALKRSL